MAKINLFKIENEKVEELKELLLERGMDEISSESVRPDKLSELEGDMTFTFYLAENLSSKPVSWSWATNLFDIRNIMTQGQSKAIILIEYLEEFFAVSFGHSFFLINKFCDYDFGFNFARRVKFQDIKTTALSSPNSQRNKSINTYIDYSNLEFDSGESFLKLKAKVNVDDDFKLYKEVIEAGTSIKFNSDNPTFESIAELILHINFTLKKEEISKIPVFNKVKDKELIEELERELNNEIEEDIFVINFSEIDIVGVDEIFNNSDYSYTIKYQRKKKDTTELNNEIIKNFLVEKGIERKSDMLDIRIVSYYDGNSIQTSKIRELIDYTNDDKKCLLSKGVWYEYNSDYIHYLNTSIAEIKTNYNPDYDFNSQIHDDFLKEKYREEYGKDYNGEDEKDVLKALKNKYYSERTFNLIREEQNEYRNFDRKPQTINQYEIEVMDLYKNKTMFAVKIGAGSAKLCYAVDQSLTSLKLYKRGELEEVPEIENVGLWLVLERQSNLKMIDNQPDLGDLKMLLLKDKIDNWKKEVRLMGYEPIIYINYKRDE